VTTSSNVPMMWFISEIDIGVRERGLGIRFTMASGSVSKPGLSRPLRDTDNDYQLLASTTRTVKNLLTIQHDMRSYEVGFVD